MGEKAANTIEVSKFKITEAERFSVSQKRERKGKSFLRQCFTANHVLLLAAATHALILYLGKSFPPLLGWGHTQSLYFIAAGMWAAQESAASAAPNKQGYSTRALQYPNPRSGTGHFEHFCSDLPFILTSFPS